MWLSAYKDIRNNDTEVVVLAVSSFHIIDAEHLWVAYGTGKTLKYIPIHQIASMLTQEEAEALPLFQAITGCDTVSYFCGGGKRTTWEVWRVFPQLTEHMSSIQPGIRDEFLDAVERFVVLCYDHKYLD